MFSFSVARYQVALGGDVRMAVAYYHKAITIDPTNGKPIQFMCACMALLYSELLHAARYVSVRVIATRE